MLKILITGSSGFVGQNVLKVLGNNPNFDIKTPKRDELDLKDEGKVERYLEKEKFDVVIHFASPTPAKNKLDSFERYMEDSLRIFMNFYNHSNLYGKMIYTGSGAEYNKALEINHISEEDCCRSVPSEAYGLSKMVQNQLAAKSDNIYNFRIFACYGPGDAETKFITHCIRSVLLNKEITIRKDCKFDYIHVYDFAKYIEYAITHELHHHNYNVTSGKAYLLSEIAYMVIDKMKSKSTVRLLSEEKGLNYTADNTRLVEECGFKPSISISEGLEMQIRWEKDNWSDKTKFDGE